MYYVTSRKHAHGNMIIWQHVKKLRGFKAEDGVEYLVAKNKKRNEYRDGYFIANLYWFEW